MDQFILNGNTYFYKDLEKDLIRPDPNDEFQRAVFDFIKKWKVGEQTFLVQTSGSTGPPKELIFTREQMIKSAERTLAYFGLKPGDSVLLCLNPSFIAGKMMLVRALVGDLKLIAFTPSSNPFEILKEDQLIDFMAATPMQMDTALRNSPKKVQQIRHILIGGAGIHSDLESRLRLVSSSALYHSFAMTETLTHVAIRKINESNDPELFKVVDGVRISEDDRSCLVISDEILKLDKLVTNDVVEIVDESSFKWIGRYDLVVNSGGIKIQIEEVEQLIRETLSSHGLNYRLCVLPVPNSQLTETLVLAIEGKVSEEGMGNLLHLLRNKLPKYHAPKGLLQVPEIFLTKSGKIDRIRNAEEYIHNRAT